MRSVRQPKICAGIEKKEKISHNPASTGEIPRFRDRALINTVTEESC